MKFPDFEVKRYYRFQIAMAMGQRTSFGFSAMAPHIPLDLGLAFQHLPPGNYYPCLVYRAGKLDCKLEYIKGPSGKYDTPQYVIVILDIQQVLQSNQNTKEPNTNSFKCFFHIMN